MKSFGQRIKDARKELGLTQEQLAARIGVSQSTIAQWEKDENVSKIRGVFELTNALGVSEEYLMGREEGEPGFNYNLYTSNSAKALNLKEGSQKYKLMGKVPVISSVMAGSWGEAEDPYESGDADDWLPCPVKHSSSTYALRVEGDSMTSSHGKSYPEGCLVFVDPENISVNTGDRVIAKINGDSKVTFKVYVEDAGKKYLKPLNSAYPLITDPFRVLGLVIGKWEYE